SLCLLVIEKTVLAKEGYIAEAKGAAAIKDNRVDRISLIAFPYAGSAYPRHAHSDCQIASEAIGESAEMLSMVLRSWTPSLPVMAALIRVPLLNVLKRTYSNITPTASCPSSSVLAGIVKIGPASVALPPPPG